MKTGVPREGVCWGRQLGLAGSREGKKGLGSNSKEATHQLWVLGGAPSYRRTLRDCGQDEGSQEGPGSEDRARFGWVYRATVQQGLVVPHLLPVPKLGNYQQKSSLSLYNLNETRINQKPGKLSILGKEHRASNPKPAKVSEARGKLPSLPSPTWQCLRVLPLHTGWGQS